MWEFLYFNSPLYATNITLLYLQVRKEVLNYFANNLLCYEIINRRYSQIIWAKKNDEKLHKSRNIYLSLD